MPLSSSNISVLCQWLLAQIVIPESIVIAFCKDSFGGSDFTTSEVLANTRDHLRKYQMNIKRIIGYDAQDSYSWVVFNSSEFKFCHIPDPLPAEDILRFKKLVRMFPFTSISIVAKNFRIFKI